MRHAAFGLPELLAVLALAAILLAAARPGLRVLLLQAAMSAEVNALVSAVHQARQTAQRSGKPVVLCPRAVQQRRCGDGSSWRHGWLLFSNHDGDRPPLRDAGEPLLRLRAAWRQGQIFANRPAFVFRPGSVRHSNGRFSFCDERGPAAATAVIIGPSGRPRTLLGDKATRWLICSL